MESKEPELKQVKDEANDDDEDDMSQYSFTGDGAPPGDKFTAAPQSHGRPPKAPKRRCFNQLPASPDRGSDSSGPQVAEVHGTWMSTTSSATERSAEEQWRETRGELTEDQRIMLRDLTGRVVEMVKQGIISPADLIRFALTL